MRNFERTIRTHALQNHPFAKNDLQRKKRRPVRSSQEERRDVCVSIAFARDTSTDASRKKRHPERNCFATSSCGAPRLQGKKRGTEGRGSAAVTRPLSERSMTTGELARGEHSFVNVRRAIERLAGFFVRQASLEKGKAMK
jgi:hypothetical protein